MKKKNYSKRAIAAANGFLANYHLTVEHLTEAQKQSVLHYVKLEKGLYWILAIQVLCSMLIIYGAWFKYSIVLEAIQTIPVPSATADASSQENSNLIFNLGIGIGIAFFCGFMPLVSAIMDPISLWHKKKTLDAFLCNIKPVTNDQIL